MFTINIGRPINLIKSQNSFGCSQSEPYLGDFAVLRINNEDIILIGLTPRTI